ncbi:hypothetical protein [Heyndrickxia sporothermodurans]|nr:hypothetical protein [Heyndrickxia sporothermodurans]
MARKRKRQPKWTLLFRVEGEQKVYLYEPLKKYELKARIRNGWKPIN